MTSSKEKNHSKYTGQCIAVGGIQTFPPRPDQPNTVTRFLEEQVRELNRRVPPIHELSTLSIHRPVKLKPGQVDAVLASNLERFNLKPGVDLKRYMRGRFVHRHKGKVLRRHSVTGDIVDLSVTFENVYPSGPSHHVPSDATMVVNYSFTTEPKPQEDSL